MWRDQTCNLNLSRQTETDKSFIVATTLGINFPPAATRLTEETDRSRYAREAPVIRDRF